MKCKNWILPSKSAKLILELKLLLGNIDNLPKSANKHILSLLEYLNKALKKLNELYNDSEGDFEENKKLNKIFKSLTRIYNNEKF